MNEPNNPEQTINQRSRESLWDENDRLKRVLAVKDAEIALLKAELKRARE